jgi:hypothetical protein
LGNIEVNSPMNGKKAKGMGDRGKCFQCYWGLSRKRFDWELWESHHRMKVQ